MALRSFTLKIPAKHSFLRGTFVMTETEVQNQCHVQLIILFLFLKYELKRDKYPHKYCASNTMPQTKCHLLTDLL